MISFQSITVVQRLHTSELPGTDGEKLKYDDPNHFDEHPNFSSLSPGMSKHSPPLPPVLSQHLSMLHQFNQERYHLLSELQNLDNQMQAPLLQLAAELQASSE